MTKKFHFVSMAAILVVGFAFTSCNDNKKFVVYQCPMNDQPDTAYAHSGKCPSCGMDLEGVTSIDTTKTIIFQNKNQ